MTIECLLADREFIGKDWIEYLQDKSINYIIRVRNNFYVNRTGNEENNFCISDLLRSVKVGETYQSKKPIFMKGNKNYVIGLRKNTVKGKSDNVILITNMKTNKALTEYKQRWQIECLFKAMKSSGFNIEDTHVKHLDRLERLISVVMIAFVWCYNVGDYVNENIEKIRIKKHNNRAISVFKLGLSILNRWLSTNRKPRKLKPLGLFSKVLYCT
ncbi:MAG: transposase [Moraxellaceae bacterium]|nr:transposase [Moraxellaceae bacterium]